jgi:hypothetical protein
MICATDHLLCTQFWVFNVRVGLEFCVHVGAQMVCGLRYVFYITEDSNERHSWVMATCAAKRNKYINGKADFM